MNYSILFEKFEGIKEVQRHINTFQNFFNNVNI